MGLTLQKTYFEPRPPSGVSSPSTVGPPKAANFNRAGAWPFEKIRGNGSFGTAVNAGRLGSEAVATNVAKAELRGVASLIGRGGIRLGAGLLGPAGWIINAALLGWELYEWMHTPGSGDTPIPVPEQYNDINYWDVTGWQHPPVGVGFPYPPSVISPWTYDDGSTTIRDHFAFSVPKWVILGIWPQSVRNQSSRGNYHPPVFYDNLGDALSQNLGQFDVICHYSDGQYLTILPNPDLVFPQSGDAYFIDDMHARTAGGLQAEYIGEFLPPEPIPLLVPDINSLKVGWQRALPNGQDPAPFRYPEPEYVPPVSTVGVTNSPRPIPLSPPKRPDGPHDRKVIPRGTAAAKFIANILGEISESAELIDALFDALPEDTKRRWSSGRIDNRSLGGQYSVSSDLLWKMEALWYNWHNVDINQAIVNVGYNVLEDAFYGKAFGGMDPRFIRDQMKGLK